MVLQENVSLKVDEQNINGSTSQWQISSSSESPPYSEKNDIAEDLKRYFLETGSKITDAQKLLRVLKKYFPQLPLSYKTLVNTKHLEPFKIEDMGTKKKFVYFGIARQIIQHINPEMHKDNKILLLFNIDGLPLFESSANEFWPILGYIVYKPVIYKPFPIAIHFGEGKPKNLDLFMNKFITELNELTE